MKILQTGASSKESEMSTAPDKKMYIILREDLAYKYIQGQHALAQFALEHGHSLKDWNNSFVINLSVFNGLALEELLVSFESAELDYAEKHNLENNETHFKFSVFYEPDLKSELPTAIALYYDGVNGANQLVKGLPLASR